MTWRMDNTTGKGTEDSTKDRIPRSLNTEVVVENK